MKLFAFTLVVAIPMLAAAQTGPALLIKPLLDEKETSEVRADALFLNNGSTSNGGADFQMSVYEASGRYREWRENFIPRLGFDFTYLDLNTKDHSLPRQLVDQSIAAGVELGTFSDWRGGLTAGVGYAGPTPFGDGDGWYGIATLVFGRKIDAKTDLVFVLDYNSNRTMLPDVPLPGIEYRHEFDPHLSYVLGAPVTSITWRPEKEWRLDFTYTILDRLDASIDYEFVPHFTVFGNFETRREAYHLDHLHASDRLLFEQRRVEAGMQWKPAEFTRLTFAAGYAFGGEFSTGWDERDTDEVADVSDEPYFRIGFETRF